MIKTETRKIWSDSCEFYPPKQVFLDFQRLKPLSFQGLRPLDPCQGRCPWTSPGALRRALDPTRAGLHGKPLAAQAMPARYSPFRYSIQGKWKCGTHRSQHPANATALMQHKPGKHVQWSGE